MEVRVPHALSPEEVARRISTAALRHDVELVPDASGVRGSLSKDAGFLGSVRAQYAIEPGALVVQVSERPAFLPEGTLRRMLEDELHKLVAG
ncbi:MAG TPA: hypothetical protein VK843_12095 [Planctomycetota bacterium]|nr:hypothetical protein [Planctomycetota bacterium]